MSSSFLTSTTTNVISLKSANLTDNNNQSTKNNINNNHLAIQQQQQPLKSVCDSGLVNHQQAFNDFVAGQQQNSFNKNNYRSQDCISNNMPKNEPVKLVYPTTQTSSSSTLVTMNNNRVTFTSAPIQNGSVTLSPMTANSLSQPNPQQATIMQRAATGQQAPTLIFKNTSSSAPGTVYTTTPVTAMSKANSQVRKVM